jgi:predicted NUDIX family NTP pyrophosphohydrolase
LSKQSAGILLYRLENKILEVFLVHPGGPFWAKKDLGAWSIPKGEFEEEDPLAAAKREFAEETGMAVDGEAIALDPQKQKSGKVVYAWAIEGDLDPADLHSNTFEMDWPPRSGKRQTFLEVDSGEWFSVEDAFQKINPGQAGFIEELVLEQASKKRINDI